MTREESLSIITEAIEDYVCNYVTDTAKAQKMLNAIQTLEQEPCEDAISRQALLKLMGEEPFNWTDSNQELQAVEDYRNFRNMVEQLPPVKPQEKTGHWIMPVNDDGMSDIIYYQVRCSKCGFDLDPQTWHQELHQYGADKYCPSCGTKMIDEQESEVQDADSN